MAAARKSAVSAVDLAAELTEEDKVVAPQFDLTADSDEDARSPQQADPSVHISSLVSCADVDEVRFWPVLPGDDFAHGRPQRFLCLRWRVLDQFITVGRGRVRG